MGDDGCFAVDDERSWPAEVRDLLAGNFEELKHFEDDTDRIVQGSLSHNRFRHCHELVSKQCGEIVERLDVLAYHCSRLHEAEIRAIEHGGLRLLTPEFSIERVRARELAGDVAPEVAGRLIAKHLADKRSRSGRIWFVINRRMLKSESGAGWLLGCWGGEALYWQHKDDPPTAATLRGLGTPCIVELAIPVSWIASSFTDVPGRLIGVFLQNRQVSPSLKDDGEGWVERDVPAARVLRVIRLTDPDFEVLTQSSRWDRPPA